jgi:glycosyltransferase involved in cell wall biosynthesis
LSTSKVAVVVPVRNDARHLPACLASLRPEVDSLGGELVVVDDASHDGSADIAEKLGACVVRMDESVGPYAARNAGWRAGGAPVLAFTDARCRARPGWLAALVEPLGRDDVIITGGDVIMRGDATVGQRWAVRDQRLRIERHVVRAFLPFVPTASMGVQRATLERLDGFRLVRSGADVDFCWRAQLAGLGRVIAAPGAVMDCDPRESAVAVVAQWRRYGEAHAHLWAEFANDGCPVPEPVSRWEAIRSGARWAIGATLKRRDPVELLDSVRHLAYQLAYRRAVAELAEGRPWK